MSETVAEFAARLGVTSTAERADSNPNAVGFGPDARHWLVTLTRPGRLLSKGFGSEAPRVLLVPFSQGSGWDTTPTIEEVLDCLASDSAGLDNAGGFADWCAEYGYADADDSALHAYGAVGRQAAALHEFLGPENYHALLWVTERL